jgi:hypothetical protein
MRGPAASSEDAPIAGFWGPQKPFSEETKMEAETQEESQAMKQGNACTVDDLSFKMHELLFSRAGQGDGLKSVAWEEPKMW